MDNRAFVEAERFEGGNDGEEDGGNDGEEGLVVDGDDVEEFDRDWRDMRMELM